MLTCTRIKGEFCSVVLRRVSRRAGRDHIVTVRACFSRLPLVAEPGASFATSRSSTRPCGLATKPSSTSSSSVRNARPSWWRTATSWASSIAKARGCRRRSARCVQLLRRKPTRSMLYLGTTGKPKGVVRDNGGHMVALNWSMSRLYGDEAGGLIGRPRPPSWVVEAFLHRLRAAHRGLHQRRL